MNLGSGKGIGVEYFPLTAPVVGPEDYETGSLGSVAAASEKSVKQPTVDKTIVTKTAKRIKIPYDVGGPVARPETD